MRITFLLEVADQLWGGVKVALEDANWLSQRGHQVTVVSRSGPPEWMQLDCTFQQVEDFGRANLPDADVLVATFWSTVSWAACAGDGKGVPVHLCQGYEGDNPENESLRDRIEAAYRLPGMHHVTISPHLTRLLRERFSIDAIEVRYAIDHRVHFPGPQRAPRSPLRVGLVGPYQIPWKDLPTGYAACELAARAGQDLVLVRASNTPPSPEERDQPFPVEWHQHLRPDQLGDYYRSLDVFLATSSGDEEGFFLPAIEAMACGVPSVLTDIPCFRNHQTLVGHDRYGLFVEPKDPTAMAEALVLAGALPDVRAALRAGGIELAGHYHQDYHGEQLEAALREFVRQAGGTVGSDLEPPTYRSGAARGPVIQPAVAPTPVAPLPANPATNELKLVSTRIPTPPAPDEEQAHADDVGRLLGELRIAAAGKRRDGHHGDAARLLAAARCLADERTAGTLLRELAECQLAAGHAEQALRTYDEQLATGADDEHLHIGRGNALYALGRMHEAAQAFRAALAVGARTADNYNLLGVVLFQAGDVQAARESFERALALDPRHADARRNLGELPAA